MDEAMRERAERMARSPNRPGHHSTPSLSRSCLSRWMSWARFWARTQQPRDTFGDTQMSCDPQQRTSSERILVSKGFAPSCQCLRVADESSPPPLSVCVCVYPGTPPTIPKARRWCVCVLSSTITTPVLPGSWRTWDRVYRDTRCWWAKNILTPHPGQASLAPSLSVACHAITTFWSVTGGPGSNPLNLSISFSGGNASNRDCCSNGEWTSDEQSLPERESLNPRGHQSGQSNNTRVIWSAILDSSRCCGQWTFRFVLWWLRHRKRLWNGPPSRATVPSAEHRVPWPAVAWPGGIPE